MGNWQHIGKPAQRVLKSFERQRLAEHIHSLGPRPVLEAFLEIEAGAGLDNVLAR